MTDFQEDAHPLRRTHDRRRSASPPPAYRNERQHYRRDSRDAGHRYDSSRPVDYRRMNSGTATQPSRYGGDSDAQERIDKLIQSNAFYATGHLLAFPEFLQVVGVDVDPRLSAEKYDQYRKQFDYMQYRAFFEQHKQDAWFREKYEPEASKAFTEHVHSIYTKNYQFFVQDFSDGKLEGISFDATQSPSVANETDTMDQDNEDGELEAQPKKTDNALLPSPPLYTAMRTSVEDTQVTELHKRPPLILIKSLPSNVSRECVQEQLQAAEPDLLYIAYGQPNPSKRYNRIAFLAFKEEADIQAAFERLNHMKIRIPRLKSTDAKGSDERLDENAAEVQDEDFELHVCVLDDDVRVKYAPEAANDLSVLRVDYEHVRDIARHFNKEINVEDPLAEHTCGPARDSEVNELKRSMDLYLAYLRRVFYYCFYCVKERCTSAEDFLRTCGDHHLRSVCTLESSDSATERRLEGWKNKVSKHVDWMLRGLDHRSLSQLHYKDPEESVEAFIGAKIQYVAPQKFKCMVADCTKMFKGPDFVRKHIQNKHPAVVEQHVQYARFVSAYLRDPFKQSFQDQSGGGLGGRRGVREVRGKRPREPSVERERGSGSGSGWGADRGGWNAPSDRGGWNGPKRSRVGYQDLDAPPQSEAVAVEQIELSYD